MWSTTLADSTDCLSRSQQRICDNWVAHDLDKHSEAGHHLQMFPSTNQRLPCSGGTSRGLPIHENRSCKYLIILGHLLSEMCTDPTQFQINLHQVGAYPGSSLWNYPFSYTVHTKDPKMGQDNNLSEQKHPFIQR